MTDHAIPDSIRAFLDDIRYATISTLDPDGMPRPAVIWNTVDEYRWVGMTGTYQRQERISFRFRLRSIYDYDDR